MAWGRHAAMSPLLGTLWKMPDPGGRGKPTQGVVARKTGRSRGGRGGAATPNKDGGGAGGGHRLQKMWRMAVEGFAWGGDWG